MSHFTVNTDNTDVLTTNCILGQNNNITNNVKYYHHPDKSLAGDYLASNILSSCFMYLLMRLFVFLCVTKKENENVKDKKQISNLNEVNLVNDCNQQKINDTGVGGRWEGLSLLIVLHYVILKQDLRISVSYH